MTRTNEYYDGVEAGINQMKVLMKETGMFYDKIDDLIHNDLCQISYEQHDGFGDGFYPLHIDEKFDLYSSNRHRGDGVVERICRNIVEGFEEYPIRIYVLSTHNGGICILGHKSTMSDRVDFTIFHLSEDDGFFFFEREGGSGIGYMDKINFIDMISRAISLLNNIKT